MVNIFFINMGSYVVELDWNNVQYLIDPVCRLKPDNVVLNMYRKCTGKVYTNEPVQIEPLSLDE